MGLLDLPDAQSAPPTPSNTGLLQFGASPSPNYNLSAANADLKLTPQETNLYNYHLNNLQGPGKVVNDDGSISTIKNITTEINGRTYVIPTVRNGQFLTPKDAIGAAKADGLTTYPSYATEDEAEQRYDAMHAYMDKDVAAYKASAAAPVGGGGLLDVQGQK